MVMPRVRVRSRSRDHVTRRRPETHTAFIHLGSPTARAARAPWLTSVPNPTHPAQRLEDVQPKLRQKEEIVGILGRPACRFDRSRCSSVCARRKCRTWRFRPTQLFQPQRSSSRKQRLPRLGLRSGERMVGAPNLTLSHAAVRAAAICEPLVVPMPDTRQAWLNPRVVSGNVS